MCDVLSQLLLQERGVILSGGQREEWNPRHTIMAQFGVTHVHKLHYLLHQGQAYTTGIHSFVFLCLPVKLFQWYVFAVFTLYLCVCTFFIGII